MQNRAKKAYAEKAQAANINIPAIKYTLTCIIASCITLNLCQYSRSVEFVLDVAEEVECGGGVGETEI